MSQVFDGRDFHIVIRTLLSTMVILILVILSADIIVQELKSVTSGLSTVFVVIPLLIYISFLLILVRLLLRYKKRSSRITITIIVVIFGMLSRVLWVGIFDSYQVSDYSSYYNCGQSIANSKDLFCSQPLVWKRSLVYTAPIAKLFGNSLSALEWMNVLLFLISALVFSIIGWRIYGSAPTIIGLFVFSFYPDYWYPTTLASHDNAGILWLSLFFLTFLSAQQSLKHIEKRFSSFLSLIFIGIAIGCILFFLDYSRGYHIFAFLVCTFYCISALLTSSWNLREIWKKLAFLMCIIIPVITYSEMHKKFERLFHMPEKLQAPFWDHLNNPLAKITAVDVLGSNKHSEMVLWEWEKFPELAKNGRIDFALRKYAHEWTYDWKQSIDHIIRKNRILGRGTGNFDFSTAGSPDSDLDMSQHQVERINAVGWRLQYTTANSINLIMFFMLILRLLLGHILPFRRKEYVIIAFSLFAFGALLLLGEAQPRYTLFLIFPLSYMFGQVAWYLGRRERLLLKLTEISEGVSKVLLWQLGFLGLMVIVCLFLLGKSIAFFELALSDLSNAQPIKKSELPAAIDWAPSFVPTRIGSTFNKIEIGYKKTTGVAKGSLIGATTTLRSRSGCRKGIELFLNTTPGASRFTSKYKSKIKGELVKYGLEYLLFVNEELVARDEITDHDSIFIEHKFKQPNNNELVLTVLLINNKDIGFEVVPDEPLLLIEYARCF